MAKFFGAKAEEKQGEKNYRANYICPVQMCNNAGTCKDNLRGDGQWFCAIHVKNPNADCKRIELEVDYRPELLRRKSHDMGIKDYTVPEHLDAMRAGIKGMVL